MGGGFGGFGLGGGFGYGGGWGGGGYHNSENITNETTETNNTTINNYYGDQEDIPGSVPQEDQEAYHQEGDGYDDRGGYEDHGYDEGDVYEDHGYDEGGGEGYFDDGGFD